MRLGALLILAAPAGFAQDAAAIMAHVAANVEQTVEARRQYVYQQTVRANLIRANGQLARREKRQYTVVPSSTGTDKKLVSFQGEYRKGKQSFTYTAPAGEQQDEGIDAGLLQGLTDSLVDDKNSRDGIPPDLFPLRTRDLPAYAFMGKGEFEYQGRRTYRIGFAPVHTDCFHIHTGKEDEGEKEDCEQVSGWARPGSTRRNYNPFASILISRAKYLGRFAPFRHQPEANWLRHYLPARGGRRVVPGDLWN